MKATLSEKGQVTIPKPLREKLGLRAGVVLEFETRGGLLIGRKRKAVDALEKVTGILPPMNVDKEIERMRGKPWNPEEDKRENRR